MPAEFNCWFGPGTLYIRTSRASLTIPVPSKSLSPFNITFHEDNISIIDNCALSDKRIFTKCNGHNTFTAVTRKSDGCHQKRFWKRWCGSGSAVHRPDVIKYFGGNNVIVGRKAVEQGANAWFQNSKVEFIENRVENTEFIGNIAIQTSIFSIKTTPKSGGQPSIGRGRSMVIYVQDKNSPTGWLTLREFVQEAPAK